MQQKKHTLCTSATAAADSLKFDHRTLRLALYYPQIPEK